MGINITNRLDKIYDANYTQINQDIKGFKQWANKGITAICTMVERHELQSFEKLRDKSGLDENERNRYPQLKDCFERETRTDTDNEILGVFQEAHERKTCRVISALYKSLMSCRESLSLYVKEKLELTEQITEEEWFIMCMLQCMATSSEVWREFNWKNIIRTPKIMKELVHNSRAGDHVDSASKSRDCVGMGHPGEGGQSREGV